MKGTIYIPNRFSKNVYITDRYTSLFDLIASKLGWTITSKTSDIVDLDADILMLFKTPQSEKVSLRSIEFIHKIPSSIKVISYFTDVHIKEQANKYLKEMEYILNRSDVILVSYYSAFIEQWEQFKNKTIWFPHFYGPTSRFNIAYNTNPIKKCLLVGENSKKYYPLRHKVTVQKSNLVECIAHPGYTINIQNAVQNGVVVRENYAKKLNEHFCSLTCCSSLNYAIAKYFEIPATGSLLIADNCSEIDTLGFKDGINYIQVNENNVMDKIEEILSNTEKYEDIRKEGMKFVRESFSVEKRADQFINILEKIYEK